MIKRLIFASWVWCLIVGIILLFSLGMGIVYHSRKMLACQTLIDSLNVEVKTQQSMLINYGNTLYAVWQMPKKNVNLYQVKVRYRGENTTLATIVDMPTTFVSLSVNNCWSCVEFLSRYIKDRRHVDVKYLLSESEAELLDAFLINTRLRKDDVYILSDGLPASLDGYDNPLLFTILPSGEIVKTLKPIKGDTLLLDLYFSD